MKILRTGAFCASLLWLTGTFRIYANKLALLYATATKLIAFYSKPYLNGKEKSEDANFDSDYLVVYQVEDMTDSLVYLTIGQKK